MREPHTGNHKATGVAIGLVIGLLLALGLWAISAYDSRPDEAELDEQYTYDRRQYDGPAPPRPVGWQQVDELPAGLDVPRAIACAPDRDRAGQVWITGDRAVRVIDRAGKQLQRIDLPFEPTCLAVLDGGLLVAGRRSVWHVPTDAEPKRVAELPEDARITAVAGSQTAWYVADAAGKMVHQYDPKTGQAVRAIRGGSDKPDDRFLVPSANFDLLVGQSGLIWIVNPGRLRVEAYTADLDWEQPLTWGSAGTRPEDFIGCCNPARLAQLPNGTFVTSEKGTRRIKFYSIKGAFESELAGPGDLGDEKSAMDVACDAVGRVFVLDADRKIVRVFAIAARRSRP